MRTAIALCLGVALGFAGAALALQQKYPRAGEPPIVFENDRVVVQRIRNPPGDWVGEHSHTGNQLAVVLSETEITYKEGDELRTTVYQKGDVFWVQATTHDHKTEEATDAILVTLK